MGAINTTFLSLFDAYIPSLLFSFWCLFSWKVKERKKWNLIFLQSWPRRCMETMVVRTMPGPHLSFPCCVKGILVRPSWLLRSTGLLSLDTLILPRLPMFFKVYVRFLIRFFVFSSLYFVGVDFCFLINYMFHVLLLLDSLNVLGCSFSP